MTSCPSCGTERVGAERFCPACGLDYWRAAAATNAPAATLELVPAAAVAVPQGRGVSGILVGAGLLLLVGTGAVAAIMIMGQDGNAPDLRAGGAAPTYTAEREIVNSFFREARDPDASFVVTMDGRMTVAPAEATGVETTIEATMQVHGADWMGDVTLSGLPDPEPVSGSAAMVDGAGYAKAADGAWQAGEAGEIGPVNPFTRIATVSEVEYVGRETSGGTTLHHLLVTKWVGGDDFNAAMAGLRMTTKENTFHIWVTAEGVPTRADYDMHLVGEGRDQTLTMGADMAYTFTNWGEVAPILPPI